MKPPRFVKLYNNLLSRNAVSCLGPRLYARYLATFLTQLPKIAKTGDLTALDRAMGRLGRRFRYRRLSFIFDCRFCDSHLRDGTYAFGVAREIYVRDCYFKWLPRAGFECARTVLDLGANRGAFASLMTTRADFILCVECNGEFEPVIRHNMAENHFSRFAVETVFLGAGGVLGASLPGLSMNDLFERHHVMHVDLIKMDIEGSEFALFANPDWLHRVKALTMEVHPHFGDVAIIIQALDRYGFSTVMADENLKRVTHAEQAGFIYAWKPSL